MKVASPPFDSLAVREMYDLWEMAFGPDIAPDITFDLCLEPKKTPTISEFIVCS